MIWSVGNKTPAQPSRCFLGESGWRGLCGEGILPLLFRDAGILPSNRGQDARDTQGRDALATLHQSGGVVGDPGVGAVGQLDVQPAGALLDQLELQARVQ